MRPTLAVLTLLAATWTSTIAVAAPPVVDLADLDSAPERFESRPLILPGALQASGIHDTVTMVAVISPDGRVEKVENLKAVNPAIAAAATESVKAWVFSRGFSQGQSVSYRMPVAVAIRPGQIWDIEADTGERIGSGATLSTAMATYETIPEYPEALRASPVVGRAVVNLLIDQDGKPADPVVEFASRPEFAAPAAAAVLEWSFSPAMKRKAPFTARTTVEVRFAPDSANWNAVEREAQAQLAYARSYDVGPREKSTIPVVFPYEPLIQGLERTLTVSVVVAPDGSVVQSAGGPGADPDCLEAARASLASWKFFPATKAGRPVFGLVVMQFSFEPRRDEFEFDDTTFELIETLRSGTPAIPGLKQVDQFPKLVKQVSPQLGADIAGSPVGEAMIEFIVDKNGRAQLPKIVRTTSPELGWAAATAVAQWRFEPAQKGGEPVACRARQVLKFSPPAPSEATP